MSGYNVSSKKCPECKCTDILFDPESGEWFCSKCGLVLHDAEVDDGPEWRSFDVNQYMSRARATTPLDPVKVNAFGKIGRDGRGNKIHPSNMHLMLQLRRLQTRSRFSDGKGRNLPKRPLFSGGFHLGFTYPQLLDKRLTRCTVKPWRGI